LRWVNRFERRFFVERSESHLNQGNSFAIDNKVSYTARISRISLR
jgi:hypothetical protein